jgi:hypothetical protein
MLKHWSQYDNEQDPLSLMQFFYWILELFRRYGIYFVFHFFHLFVNFYPLITPLISSNNFLYKEPKS